MTGNAQVWDKGLQPERTSLGWMRLSLALLALTLVIPRLAWDVLGAWVLVPTTFVGAASLTLLAESRRRYLHAHRRLTAGHGQLPDGRLPLITTVAVLLVSVVALVIVWGW